MSLISNIVKNVNYIIEQTGVGTPIATGGTLGRESGAITEPDNRAIYQRIKTAFAESKVFDLNGFEVGAGTEYKFFYQSQNLARGVNLPTEFVNLIANPTARKLPLYAIINKRIPSSILADFKGYYKLEWFSGAASPTGEDISKAIAKRLEDINSHLGGLKISLDSKNAQYAISQVKDTGEIATRVGLQIASLIPVSRPIGLLGTAILTQQDAADRIVFVQKMNDINRDAKLLELEATALINLYKSKNSVSEKELLEVIGTEINTEERSANTNQNIIYLLVIVLLILILLVFIKNRKTKKRK